MDDISKWPIEKRRSKLEDIYLERMGVPLNLDHPKRFTEKQQWRKLYENDPRLPQIVDKLTFKQYIRERLGEGYTAPIIDVWHNSDDVDLRAIPDNCIVKSNCGSDTNFCLRVFDKNDIDIDVAEKNIKESWFDRKLLNTNSFASWYYNIKPCVIVEGLIDDTLGGPDDYKFYCFDGEPHFMLYIEGRFDENGVRDFSEGYYTTDMKLLDVHYGNHKINYNTPKTRHMEKMLEISRLLSKDFSFVRVDFMEGEKGIFLSEMTFTHSSGFAKYVPEEFDYEWGELWHIPQENQ